MRDSRNPDVPHPGMMFYSGAWRTPQSIEKKRAWVRENSLSEKGNALRVGGGSSYLGRAPTIEGAETLNTLRREYRVRK